MRQWFTFKSAVQTPSLVEIQICDVIGSWDDDWFARNYGYDMGVTARAFVEQLAALPDTVNTLHVHINSPGGDVQGGIQIANALRMQASNKGRVVETFVDALAASIASVIAMAGSKVHMADNALMMIHNPCGGVVGDASDLRKAADILDAMRSQAVNTYQWHSPMSSEDLIALMEAETWMNAEEAIAAGLATEKTVGLAAMNTLPPASVARLNVPDRYRAQFDAIVEKPKPAPASDSARVVQIVDICAEAGMPELARGFLSRNLSADDATREIATETERRALAASRSDDVRALCEGARLGRMADTLVQSATPLDGVRAILTSIRAAMDEASGEIDPSLPLDSTKGSAGASKPWADVFAKMTPGRQ